MGETEPKTGAERAECLGVMLFGYLYTTSATFRIVANDASTRSDYLKGLVAAVRARFSEHDLRAMDMADRIEKESIAAGRELEDALSKPGMMDLFEGLFGPGKEKFDG